MNDLFVPIATSIHQQDEEKQVNKAYLVTWEDTFFDDEENLIAVFDFDYPLMEAYCVKLQWLSTITLLVNVLLLVSMILIDDSLLSVLFFVLVALDIKDLVFLKKKVQWDVYSHHLCITRDGIKYVRDKHKTCFGWPCPDAGKTTQIVPLDKVTNVDIMEPVGNTYCCIRNTLTTVIISKAPAYLESRSLELRGLKDPYKFKNYIMEIKRTNTNSSMKAYPASG
jgi:hypothetical protein